MASHVVVIAADLRRATVKVNPGTYLTDVLEQACTKFSLSSSKYLLKHKQKNVDLSVPFRTSGLIPGAKLELVLKSNTPAAIQVALQLPPSLASAVPGGRLISKFPSDFTIWQVLRQFESGNASQGKNMNLTARGLAKVAGDADTGSGQLYYETPVLNIMGRELSRFEDFAKTLSGMGYNSGSVLIRLSFRGTDKTLFDAMSEIGQLFRDEEKDGAAKPDPVVEGIAPGQPTDATRDAVTPSDTEAPIQAPSQPQSSSDMPIDTTPVPTAEETLPTGEPPSEPEVMDVDPSSRENRLEPVNVFLAPTSDVPLATLAPRNEADYMPTVAHAQLHQARLLESSRNKRLLSDAELAEQSAAEEARLAAVKSLLIKVRFPDNTSSEWRVAADESGSFLYNAVRHVMDRPQLGFHLVLPDRTVIRDASGPRDGLVRGYKLAGRVLVNLVWNEDVPSNERRQPFLRGNVASQGRAVQVQDVPEAEPEEQSEPVSVQKPRAERSSGDDGSAKKVPKWFKFGKK